MAWTELHYAARNGDSDLIREMMKAGYHDLQAEETTGKTALILAAKWGRDHVVELLIRANCDVYHEDKVFSSYFELPLFAQAFLIELVGHRMASLLSIMQQSQASSKFSKNFRAN